MTEARPAPAGHGEPHGGGMAIRLNWLRAAVLMLALERREFSEAPQAEMAESTRKTGARVSRWNWH